MYVHAVATTPAEPLELVALPNSPDQARLQRQRPSPLFGRVGFRVDIFEACSAFTRVTACTLAKSPKATLYTEGFNRFVTSSVAPIATGWRVNGQGCWLWCFTNDRNCYYTIEYCRGSPVVQEFFTEAFDGVLITDFWAAYDSVDAADRQKCIPHLLRELAKVDLRNDSAEWQDFPASRKWHCVLVPARTRAYERRAGRELHRIPLSVFESIVRISASPASPIRRNTGLAAAQPCKRSLRATRIKTATRAGPRQSTEASLPYSAQQGTRQ